MNAYETWWDREGSGMPPVENEDHAEHVHRLTEIAWHNGAYVASATVELCGRIREAILLALRQEDSPRDVLAWLSGKLECVDPVLTTAIKAHLERTRTPSEVDRLIENAPL